MAVKNLVGQLFGRLWVLRRVVDPEKEAKQHSTFWECRCFCGDLSIYSASTLKCGRSGGCIKCRAIAIGKTLIKHGHHIGGKASPVYKAWQHMKDRCYNPKDKKYKDYGGRGIQVCGEWLASSSVFINWCMANGWKPGLTLDRINVNGNYDPLNCRWTTMKEQSNNKRNNHVVTVFGETMTLKQASEKHGAVSYRCTHDRINKLGWSVLDALLTPSRG